MPEFNFTIDSTNDVLKNSGASVIECEDQKPEYSLVDFLDKVNKELDRCCDEHDHNCDICPLSFEYFDTCLPRMILKIKNGLENK